MKKKNSEDILLQIIKWIGRIFSAIMILLMLAFVFDEGLPKLLSFKTPDIILFFAFFIILAGYIVSWKKESLGAILINSGTIFFWSVNTVATGNLWMGWFLFFFPLSSIPMIYYWWKQK